MCVLINMPHTPAKYSHKDLISILILILSTVITFYSVTKFDFLNWDDDQYVLANPRYHNVSSNNFCSYFKGYDVGNYHPLTMWSYSLDFRQGKPDAAAMHRTNLILHVLNTLLMYLLLRYMSFNVLMALAAAALFSVHPFRVEPVAWVSARKDLLMLLFYLSAFASYLFFYRNKSKLLYLLSIVLFAAACLSKATAVTLPVVLTLYFFMIADEKHIRNYLYLFPHFVIAFTVGVVAIDSQQSLGAIQVDTIYPFSWRLLFALYNAAVYTFQQIIPAGLQIYYPYPQPQSINWWYIIPGALCAVLSLSVGWSVRRHSGISFFFLAGLIMLLPVLQLLPVGKAMRADRYTYEPAVFWSAAVLLLFQIIFNKKIKVMYSAAVLMIFVSLFITFKRLPFWRNNESLWTQALVELPHWATALNNLGIHYLNVGDMNRSISYFKESLKYEHGEGAYINLGFLYNEKGLPDTAYSYLHKGVSLFPNNALMLNNYAQTLYLLKRYDEALHYVNRSLKLLPDNAYAWRNRAFIYEALGEQEKCCADVERALQLRYTEMWGDDLLQLQQKLCK